MPKKPKLPPPEKTITLELTEMEVAAIVLCAEEEHKSCLRMVETHGRDNPFWAKCADAWASLRRKLTGTDELT